MTVAVMLALAVLAVLLVVAGCRVVAGLPSVTYQRTVTRLERAVEELESAYQLRWSTLEAHRELAGWQRFATGAAGWPRRGPGPTHQPRGSYGAGPPS
jgi:hypothetical protein